MSACARASFAHDLFHFTDFRPDCARAQLTAASDARSWAAEFLPTLQPLTDPVQPVLTLSFFATFT